MFDIASLDTKTLSEAGVPMPIPNPRSGGPMLDTEGKPVTISLLGPNSEKSRTMQRTFAQRRADMQSRGVTMTTEDFSAERHDFLVAITVGWTFDTLAGQPFPFTPENARKFWADSRWEWLQGLAWRYANEDGNYLPNSSGG